MTLHSVLFCLVSEVVVAAAAHGSCKVSEDDTVSFIQVTPTPPPHSHMEWHAGKEWEAVENNLGGTGPLSGLEELRFRNVSIFYPDENTDDSGTLLDLLVQAVSPYVNSASPNKNGGHGEFGAIQFDPMSGAVFRWSFVKMGTHEKVVIPDFVITFFDLDQKTKEPPCVENITAWNVHSYGIVADAYTQVTIEDVDRLRVCSYTDSSIPNPRRVNGLSDDQKKASVILAYQDTAEFLLSMRNNDRGKRKFQFSGPSTDMAESVRWLQAHPTAAPTVAPTGSPTGMPTHFPTLAPTATPTGSPTGMPTHSPTSTPTSTPTESPTSMPTFSPTATPTSTPTRNPTGMPTHSPTHSPTTAPTPPTPSPTASPTSTSTAAEPTAFGDPHVMNTAGEKFNIERGGSHTFLSIPRGMDAEHADLQVQGYVDSRGDACEGQHYITELALAGSWLGTVHNMAFFTATEEFNSLGTIGLRVAETGNISVEEFVKHVSPEMLELVRFHPEQPKALNQHVATLVAKLSLGPIKIKVTWQHTKEKLGFSNSLMLVVTGLGKVQGSIGGLLGEDSHRFAASPPPACAARHTLLQRPRQNGVRAAALLDEDDK